MKRLLIHFLIFACVTTSFSSTADTQEKTIKMGASADENKTKDAKPAIDPLSITVTGDAMNRVGQPLFVVFEIQNTTNSDLTLKSVSLNADGMASDRIDSSTECQLQQSGEIVLKKGGSLQQSCRFSMKPMEKWWVPSEWRGYLFASNVRFAVSVSIRNMGAFNYYPSIVISANEVSIFLGGLFGAILLALFIWTQQLIEKPAVRAKWLLNLGYTALFGVRGGIMAVIALLIGKTTQGTGSPVSLTVVDFTGGIMIGIFSYPLASWLATTLKTQNTLAGSGSGSD